MHVDGFGVKCDAIMSATVLTSQNSTLKITANSWTVKDSLRKFYILCKYTTTMHSSYSKRVTIQIISSNMSIHCSVMC